MEGKKSFVLYTDLIHTVKKLPKDKQADLFVMILEYVNDMNPTTEDLLLDVAFEPVKRQLKRDLDKWEKERDTKSESGSIGNLKRWNKDLFDKFKKGELPLSECLKIAKDRTAIKESQEVANIAVNGSVNVNDTVTDNVIKSIYTVADAFQFFDKKSLSGRYFSKMNNVHNLNEDIIQEQFKKWKEINEDQNFENEKHLQNSFNNWLRSYKPEKKKNGHAAKTNLSPINWDEI